MTPMETHEQFAVHYKTARINDLGEYQPPTLIVWGKNDFVFPPEGAIPYSRDLKNVQTYLPDTGHFALETHVEEIASRIESFFLKHKTTAA